MAFDNRWQDRAYAPYGVEQLELLGLMPSTSRRLCNPPRPWFLPAWLTMVGSYINIDDTWQGKRDAENPCLATPT